MLHGASSHKCISCSGEHFKLVLESTPSERIEAIWYEEMSFLSPLSPVSIQCLGSFHSVILLLYTREEDFSVPKNMRKKVCILLMSRRNIKCIKFVMQFVLNNSALQKWHSKWYPKNQSACKSLYIVHH